MARSGGSYLRDENGDEHLLHRTEEAPRGRKAAEDDAAIPFDVEPVFEGPADPETDDDTSESEEG
ncbi:hypothetical protein [Spongiibacter marinus]|uniref:hypothetical protein n=1 Tax=Spongiibacter marinus TaxID=354246 RepID=UPI00195F87ED|nr:hypothetical protein [Spongiibacter marinus]MBM7425063.1 hypothetical protein [Spongiibacter marinus]